MQDLIVSLVQTTQVWEDKTSNLNHFDRLLKDVPKADLVVLPEMFNTGFTMNAEKHAESTGGQSIEWLRERSAEHHFHLAATLIIKEEGHFYNRFVMVSPTGELAYYDKRHLFSMAGEHTIFSPGLDQPVWSVNGWNISPQVCYDLRFPVWSRNRSQYDVLLYSANWPKKRINHWKFLLRARAVENQCYVAAVNRIGYDGNDIEYNGNSMIVDFDGNHLSINEDDNTILTSTLSAEALKQRRQDFPVLNDADVFDLR